MPSLSKPHLSAGSLASRTQPTLTDGDLMVRPWVVDDLGAVVAGYADPAVQRWHCRTMTAAEALSWIDEWPGRWRAENGAGWAVVRDGRVAGQISLRRIHLAEGLAEVSYWVLPGERGHRIAPRALRLLSDWALGDLGLHRIELNHSTANPASCRVAERAGFAGEGVKRSEALHADGWHDMHAHARIHGDQP